MARIRTLIEISEEMQGEVDRAHIYSYEYRSVYLGQFVDASVQ